jgi:membrane-bound serine protease (ClpP class)
LWGRRARGSFGLMAVHPKLGLLGAALLGAIVFGLILFLVGRFTAGIGMGPIIGGVAIGITIVASVTYGIWRHLPSSRRLEGILHLGSQPSAEGYVSARARSELIGKTGIAASELRPVGVAEIMGERVDVTTEGDFVSPGTPITVVHAEGMRLVVRPVRQVTPGSSPPSGS